MRDRQCPRKHSTEGLISGKPDFSSLMELQAVRQQATRVGNWWRHVSVYKEWAARSFNVNLIFLTPKCQRCFALLSRFTRRKSKPFTADPVKLKAETRVRRRLLSDITTTSKILTRFSSAAINDWWIGHRRGCRKVDGKSNLLLQITEGRGEAQLKNASHIQMVTMDTRHAKYKA